ncbi:MAG: hypothetical protein H6657_09740 [Ardenticatenaceae bacterium]|nr:hypothetical protein [Anaerolineales bacterium]MCB8977691.1 hypothetical protein [Ardenticatenaceae bacterium]
MNPELVNHRYRLFLFVLAGFIFIGSVVELALEGHTQVPTQWIPFVLSGLGIVAITAVLGWPNRKTIWALRGVMGLTALGSFLGMYEHLAHNIEFALEIRPNAVVSDVFFEALRGANPLLAPGILALGALLALAATYYHPALEA